MTFENCYFCGVADETVLVDHHVIPKEVDPEAAHDDLTVTVCRNCHTKVHDVVDPLIENVDVEVEKEYQAILTKSGERDAKPEVKEAIGDDGSTIEEIKDEADTDNVEGVIEALQEKGEVYYDGKLYRIV